MNCLGMDRIAARIKTNMFMPQTAKMAVVTCQGSMQGFGVGRLGLTVCWYCTIAHNQGDFEATLSDNLGKTGILNALLFLFFGT